MDAPELVRRLALLPHPEGGWYRETYRSALTPTPPGFPGPRSAATAIFYLLERGTRSRWHRIRSDELWHFHLGGALEVLELLPDGTTRTTTLGADLAAGQVLQHAVPAGAWFGARPLRDYSLVGCTVAPGFDFADFEMGDAAALRAAHPAARDFIDRLA